MPKRGKNLRDLTKRIGAVRDAQRKRKRERGDTASR